jgi:hypothetical protein
MTEVFMRATLIGLILAIAVGSGSPVAAASPSADESRAAAEFFLAACRGSADNLSAVADLARRQNWTSMRDPGFPEKEPIKVDGMWRVVRNGLSYSVTTGTGPDGKTGCQVAFDAPRPDRDAFFATVSHALTLTPDLDQAMTHFRLEIYRIENLAPKNVVLLFLSSHDDGAVFTASIMVN